MGLINIGAGLAAMGQGISNFASTMGTLAMKQQMQQNMAVLSNQLRYQTASKLQGQSEQFQTGIEKSREASAQSIASGQEQSAQTIASGANAARLKAAGIEAGAALGAANIRGEAEVRAIQDQISGDHISMMFKPDGTVFRVNAYNGETSPIVGADGKPLHFLNPEITKAAFGIIAQNNAVYTALSSQYSQTMATLRSQMSDISNSTDTLTSAQKNAKLAPLKKAAAEATANFQSSVNAVRNSSVNVLKAAMGGSDAFLGGGGTPNSGTGTAPAQSVIHVSNPADLQKIAKTAPPGSRLILPDGKMYLVPVPPGSSGGTVNNVSNMFGTGGNGQ